MEQQKHIYYSHNQDGPYYEGSYEEAYEDFISTQSPSITDKNEQFTKKFLEDNSAIELHECDFIQYPASQYLVPHKVTEDASEQAYDRIQMEGFDWLDGLNKDQQDDLEATLAKAFDEWATKHDLHPTFSECNGTGHSIWVKPLTPTAYEIIEKPNQD